MTYRFVRLICLMLNVLPRRLRYAIGAFIGETGWILLPRRRRDMAIRNIMHGLSVSRDEAWQIARDSSTRFGRMFIEVFFASKLNAENIHEYIRFSGKEHLDDALAHGKGVILATAHTGNWELMGAALAIHGYPIVGIAQKQHSSGMDKFINEQRTAPGMEVVYKSEVRDMVRLMAKGKIVGLLMDQDARDGGIFVDFLGRPSSTPPGPAAIARLCNAPIVPAFITEEQPGHHAICFHPAVWIEKTADRNTDLRQVTQQLSDIIEQHIRTYPHEWFWLHNRWKTEPPAVNSLGKASRPV